MYECPICLEEHTHDKLKIMICGHKICTECEMLLIESGQYKYCPICRIPLHSYIDLTSYMSEGDVIGHVVEHVQIPPLSVSNDAVLFYMDENDHDQFERQQRRERQQQRERQQRQRERQQQREIQQRRERQQQHHVVQQNTKCWKVIINTLYCVIILAGIFIVFFSNSL